MNKAAVLQSLWKITVGSIREGGDILERLWAMKRWQRQSGCGYAIFTGATPVCAGRAGDRTNPLDNILRRIR